MMMIESRIREQEHNKKLVRELVENVYGGEVDRLDEFVSADYVDHSRWRDRDGLRNMLTQFETVYPFRAFVVDDVIAEKDKVAALIRCEYGRKPGADHTEKTVRATVVFRIANGKVVEHWGHSDSFY